MKNKVFVNQIKNAYTYYLDHKLNKLYAMSINNNVTLDAMRKNIRNYIWNAIYSYPQNNYTKKKWFLNTVYSINNKYDLYMFCRNSVNKARITPVH